MVLNLEELEGLGLIIGYDSKLNNIPLVISVPNIKYSTVNNGCIFSFK